MFAFTAVFAAFSFLVLSAVYPKTSLSLPTEPGVTALVPYESAVLREPLSHTLLPLAEDPSTCFPFHCGKKIDYLKMFFYFYCFLLI